MRLPLPLGKVCSQILIFLKMKKVQTVDTHIEHDQHKMSREGMKLQPVIKINTMMLSIYIIKKMLTVNKAT